MSRQDIHWLFQDYLTKKRIAGGIKELASLSGIKYATLNKRIEHPELFRAYELKALDDVLQFEPEDLLRLIRT